MAAKTALTGTKVDKIASSGRYFGQNPHQIAVFTLVFPYKKILSIYFSISYLKSWNLQRLRWGLLAFRGDGYV